MDHNYAILSMDIEDWYHLDYFTQKKINRNYSMLDGVKIYGDILKKYNIKTTFFVLSELLSKNKKLIQNLAADGHEIACHGKTHARPLTLSVSQFKQEVTEAKDSLEQALGQPVIGYRAPCYSIDNKRYDILKDIGFNYSSSKMDVSGHPLYGSLDLSSYSKIKQGIYEKDNFFEFALSTQKCLGKDIAVSGGGWIRIFPWQLLMKPLIKKYLSSSELYTLYIHPFEFSAQPMPKVSDAGLLNHIRSHRGLGKVSPRFEELISLLQRQNFHMMTFQTLLNSLKRQ